MNEIPGLDELSQKRFDSLMHGQECFEYIIAVQFNITDVDYKNKIMDAKSITLVAFEDPTMNTQEEYDNLPLLNEREVRFQGTGKDIIEAIKNTYIEQLQYQASCKYFIKSEEAITMFVEIMDACLTKDNTRYLDEWDGIYILNKTDEEGEDLHIKSSPDMSVDDAIREIYTKMMNNEWTKSVEKTG